MAWLGGHHGQLSCFPSQAEPVCAVTPAGLPCSPQAHPKGGHSRWKLKKPHHVGAIVISPLTNQFRELSLKSGQDSHTVEKEGCLLRVCGNTGSMRTEGFQSLPQARKVHPGEVGND